MISIKYTLKYLIAYMTVSNKTNKKKFNKINN